MTMTAPAPAAPPGFWRRYGARWASAPRDLVAVLALGLTGYVAFAVTVALFSWGVGALAAFLLGVFVIIGGFYAARGLGWLDLQLLDWTGLPRIPRPAWPTEPGFWGWMRSLFGNAHYWLYLLYYLLPRFVVSVVTFTVALTAVGVALGGIFWFTWAWALPVEPRWGPPFLPDFLERAEWPVWAGVARTMLGVVVAFCLPWILRGLIWTQWGLARLMLGAFKSEALEQKLVGAQASRAAAVAAEDSSIRRIERDIHDGPQQRLIRLQMDLASAERRLAESPDDAKTLIASANEQAREALEELRALSRGFAPPILLDRGLIAALESAATRTGLPVEITGSVPAGALPPEIERNAYFIASEALTNAVKHARASRIGIAVTTDPIGRALTIAVSDDGAGGAVVVPDHGLAGLQDRVRGLGGTLAIDSPAGGPTVVTARLPW